MKMQKIDAVFQTSVYHKLELVQFKTMTDMNNKEKGKEADEAADSHASDNGENAIALAIHIGHVIEYLKRHRYGFHFLSFELTPRKIKVLHAAALSSTLLLLGIVLKMVLSEELVEQIKHYFGVVFRVVS
jgi:hypothetical protein